MVWEAAVRLPQSGAAHTEALRLPQSGAAHTEAPRFRQYFTGVPSLLDGDSWGRNQNT
jgi:hypothetical protein